MSSPLQEQRGDVLHDLLARVREGNIAREDSKVHVGKVATAPFFRAEWRACMSRRGGGWGGGGGLCVKASVSRCVYCWDAWHDCRESEGSTPGPTQQHL